MRWPAPALLLASIAATGPCVGLDIPLAERRSGYEQMNPETRAMQDDDAANPGMLWVVEGEAIWNRKPATGAPACAGCHGRAPDSMKGVAARHPAYDAESARPIDLVQRIDRCRTRRQNQATLPHESREMLALAAFVALQSRGHPIGIDDARGLQPFIDAGRRLFARRAGQLDIACTHCHDAAWGRRLGGSVIPQGHPNGYPTYRLEWQGLGSLQRRIRGCMASVRAEPFDYGAPELLDLEVFLMWRARGMRFEAPAVRP
jgi:sulfur-oxidizing protein SoxA